MTGKSKTIMSKEMAKANFEARGRGRPTNYDANLAAEICWRMAEGESLSEICRDDGYPSAGAVRMWAVNDVDGFNAKYTQAAKVRMDQFGDEIIRISDDPNEDPARARLKVDTRKWLMSKIAPKRFGDRTQHEVTGRNGGPLQTMDLTGYSDERLVALAAVLDADTDAGSGSSGDTEA